MIISFNNIELQTLKFGLSQVLVFPRFTQIPQKHQTKWHKVLCVEELNTHCYNTSAPVFDCLSLPAKSTRFNLPTLMWFSLSAPVWKYENDLKQSSLLFSMHYTWDLK